VAPGNLGDVEVLINDSGVSDTSAPAWPEGSALLASDITSSTLKLSWPSAADNNSVTAYKIYLNDTEIQSLTGDTLQTTIQNLNPGQIAVFRVEAEDAAGNVSSTGLGTIIITKPEGDWQDTSAAYYHGQSIAGDGSLWGWGQNSVGQIGDGTTNSKTRPTATNSGSNWSSVTSGDAHSLALKNDGTLWAWGSNTFGQAGTDTAVTEVHTPQQIGTDSNWSYIAAGYQFSAAIKSDGTLWTWGSNNGGKLGIGDNSTAETASLVKVGTDNDWSSVSLGTSHALALKADGSLWSWGFNGMGQLGLGTGSGGSPVPE
jgi:hypothetical protein